MAAVAEIPDLWGQGIKVDQVSPLAILKTQAELLSIKTKGLLIGRTGSLVVGEKENAREEVHQFEIYSPVLNFTEHLFEIRHKERRPYPVTITLPERVAWPVELMPPSQDAFPQAIASPFKSPSTVLATECECRDGDVFIRALGVVLTSSAIRSAIDSILAMSNERNLVPVAS